MRKVHWFLLALALEAVGLAGLHGSALRSRPRPAAAIAARYSLTDLALWTEARYCRHPSQADLFSAFQLFPGAPDFFPAGSLVAPVRPGGVP